MSDSEEDELIEWSYMPWLKPGYEVKPALEIKIHKPNVSRSCSVPSKENKTSTPLPFSKRFSSYSKEFSVRSFYSSNMPESDKVQSRQPTYYSSQFPSLSRSVDSNKDTERSTIETKFEEKSVHYNGFQTKWSSFDGGSLLWKTIKTWTSDRPDGFMNCSSERLTRFICSASFLIFISAVTIFSFMYGQVWNEGDISQESGSVLIVAQVAALLLPVFIFLVFVVITVCKGSRWVELTRFFYIFGFLLVLNLVSYYSSRLLNNSNSSATGSCSIFYYQNSQLSKIPLLKFILCSKYDSILSVPQILSQLSISSLVIYSDQGRLLTYSCILLQILTSSFLVITQLVYLNEILISALICFLTFYSYHSIIISFHCYAKLGWLKYDWDNPFLTFHRVIWFLDGLDATKIFKFKKKIDV